MSVVHQGVGVKFFTLLVGFFIFAAPAAAQKPPGLMVQTKLIAETATVSPGQEFWVGIDQKIAPGWHTYWVNPGDAGEPLTLEWSLPPGFTASDIYWPLPDVIPVASLVNYGYHDRALMLIKIRAPQGLPLESVTLSAKARWLVCADVCIPEEAAVSLRLAGVAPDAAMASAEAGDIAQAAAALPGPSPWSASLRLAGGTAELTLNGAPPGPARFYPVTWGYVENAGEQKVSTRAGGMTITMKRGDLKTVADREMKGLVVFEGAERKGYWVTAAIDSTAAAPLQKTEAPSAPAGSGGETLTFAVALLFAALGGVILNVMPCVFPVLSLKALSLSTQPPQAGRKHGVAYLAGVMMSFAALAAAIIAAREMLGAVGWGFQFQSPVFVLGMAVVFFALGLSLSGVFDIGAGWMGVGDSAARRDGAAGSFFTGVLATLAATPCTAPFMGAALGYALAQPAWETFAVLMALGAGFAAPMTVLSLTPALRRFLPKPGSWMGTLKQAMAFPLYATAAWLVWVLSVQRGPDGVLAAAIALTGAGFACWLWGRSMHGAGRFAAFASAAAVLAFAFFTIPAAAPTAPQTQTAWAGPTSEPFSTERVAALQSEGRPVFVNFTAAWCITCIANERLALSSARVADAFKARNVAYLKADWTNYDPAITASLQSFGRAGVPLYVFYPPSGAPDVLPQILTEAAVLDRLETLPTQQAKGNSDVRN
jgi:thiol:disulfide interchange protein DsbD